MGNQQVFQVESETPLNQFAVAVPASQQFTTLLSHTFIQSRFHINYSSVFLGIVDS